MRIRREDVDHVREHTRIDEVVGEHVTLKSGGVGSLKGVAAVYVMTAAERQPVYVQQREMLTELARALLAQAPAGLEPNFAAVWAGASDDAARVRAIVDQVASLTDMSAVAWHRRLHP